ncbi:MAG: nucleoside hydrolase [Anaerolineae bacterium]|nr:nucleoside hydrolase [Anaerolineae bacterium]
MATRILFDGDPGIDDAMALFFGLLHPELDFVGITTVFGNTTVEFATRNTLQILEAANRTDVPVVMGASHPLLKPLAPRWGRIHGADGLGNQSHLYPTPTTRPLDVAAATFIVETVMANPGEVTLVPVGRMTNLALALRLEPRIVENVKEVVVMGGAAFVPGNASPVAEANIREDAHASNIVFSAGWPLVMVGLDVTMKVPMTPAYINSIAEIGRPETDFIAKIAPFYQQAYAQFHNSDGTIYCHDAYALAYILNPGLFGITRVPVYVETEGLCAGFTVPDTRNRWESDSVEIGICTSVDADGVLDLYRDTLKG